MLPVNSTARFAIAFLLLFLLYHAAEYMIVLQESAAGFLLFQLVFFLSARRLGCWFGGNGLAAWGLSFDAKSLSGFLTGAGLGVGLYAVPHAISLCAGVETVAHRPDATAMVRSCLPFAFGVLFSSVSEDILTRGLVYNHFGAKLKPLGLVLLSAGIYLVNHVHRLTDGPETWGYLFLLGVAFMIPLVFTRSLWLTAGMHWAGNTFFFLTHSVIRTATHESFFSSNGLLSSWLVLVAPVLWVLCRRLSRDLSPVSGGIPSGAVGRLTP